MQSQQATQGLLLDAYIITSFDEHLNEFVQEFDERRRFISGFSGKTGTVVVTQRAAALWTDERYAELADHELDCDWKIFRIGEHPKIADWLATQIHSDAYVGTDARMVSHTQFMKWKNSFREKYLQLFGLNRNLIDFIWNNNRPEPRTFSIKTHPIHFAGEKWQSKVRRLKEQLRELNVDGMIVTSLTEIAYLFNLRGYDVPYTPVFKAYAIVTFSDVYLYTNINKVTEGVHLHLNSKACHLERDCVHIRNYYDIWNDLRVYSNRWKKVLVPGPNTFDHGASEAIFAPFYTGVAIEMTSPILFMKAMKNDVERKGMRNAHVRDSAAVCFVLAYLEDRVSSSSF